MLVGEFQETRRLFDGEDSDGSVFAARSFQSVNWICCAVILLHAVIEEVREWVRDIEVKVKLPDGPPSSSRSGR